MDQDNAALLLPDPPKSPSTADTNTTPASPELPNPPGATAATTTSASRKRGLPALAAAAAEASGSGRGRARSLGRSESPGSSTASPRPRKRGKRDDSGADLWDDDLDRVLRHGMTILPNMGRRTIWLEDDEQSYGRNGLLAEYVRRQTGKVRNRTQLASHLAVLRKNNPDDVELRTLVIGHDVAPEAFAAINWSALLGPDLYPHTRETAKAVNNAVKSHRDVVVANQKARRFAGLIAQYTPNLDNVNGDTPYLLPDGTPATSAAAAAAAVAAQNAATAKAAAAAAAGADGGQDQAGTGSIEVNSADNGIVGLKVGAAGTNGTDPTNVTSSGGKPAVKKKRGPYKTKARLAAAAAALQAQFPEYASGAVPIDPAVAAAAAAAAMNAKPPSKMSKAKAAAANGGSKLDLPTPPREYFDATTVAAVAAAAAAALEQQQQQAQIQQALAGLPDSAQLPANRQHSIGSSAMSSAATVSPVEAIDPMLQQQVATPPAHTPITSAAPHALQHHHIFGSSTSTNAIPSTSSATGLLSPSDISVNSPTLQHYSHAGPSSVSPAMTTSLAPSAPRGRGRPRKHPLPSHMQQSLPADSAAIAAAAAAAVLALPPAQQQHVQPNVTAHQQQIAEAAANQAARVSKKSAAAAARKLQQQQRLQQQQEELRLQLQGARPRMPPPPLQQHHHHHHHQQPQQQQIAPNALYAPQGAEMAATGTIYGHDYNSLLAARPHDIVGKHVPVASTSAIPLHESTKEATVAAATESAAAESATTPLSPAKGKGTVRRFGARSAIKVASDEAAEIPVSGEHLQPVIAEESAVTNGKAASPAKGKGKATAKGLQAAPGKGKRDPSAQDLEVDAIEQEGGVTAKTGADADEAPVASAHGKSGGEHADGGAATVQDLEVGNGGDDVHVGEPTTPSRRPSELDEDGEYDETGKKWLSGVKKGFMRLVGY